jgi:hypothetical protein
VKFGLELLTNAMLNYSGDVIGQLFIFIQNIASGGLIPAESVGLGQLSVYMLGFDATLLKFMNSHYYLQYLLIFAFVVAMVPAFRLFGRRLIGFLIMLYVVYVPLFIIGHWGVAAVLSKFVSPRVAEYGQEWILALAGSLGGALAISIMLPAVAVLFAAKLCKGIKNGL